jgi:hypothetical protein
MQVVFLVEDEQLSDNPLSSNPDVTDPNEPGFYNSIMTQSL